MTDVLPDESSTFGQRVRARLRDESLIWLTTTGADGTPQPNPVWFLWDGADTLIVYNRADARRLEHVAVRPRISLNLDGNGQGGDIVVLAGVAEQALDEPGPDRNAQYAEKYRDGIASVSGSPEQFAVEYPVPLRIRVTKVRGH